MPPRERVSKEQVLNTAFRMTRENGFEEVTARKLAEQLNSSTQPIFRAYANMDMLKKDLFFKSAEYFSDYMLSKKTGSQPVYLSMGMAYIDLAQRERHLFKLIASIDDYGTEDIREFLQGENSELPEKLPDTGEMDGKGKRELFRMIWMFTHGVATLVTAKRVNMTDKEIKKLLMKAYEGFLDTYRPSG
ncbi:MAG: TetR/AcrR family transcriptional regulator [Lachnospiraceae bacterium]|nr:TetR/AcrR family transcriptional regulator [Lachnospiraceae bacterium]